MKNIYEVNDINTMIHFLKQKGKNHRYYYHYTNWDSLEKIMKNGTFLLTRGNCTSINDQHEAYAKGSIKEWNKTFISSFSFGESENMAMWGLYGIPWEDAVRICIPNKQMKLWIESIDRVGVWMHNQIKGFINDADISLNDIVYVSGESRSHDLKLTHAGKSMSISNLPNLWGMDHNPQMTGYVKSYAWQYENEVRLRIHLRRDEGIEKLCVKIPQEVLEKITITTGPSFEWKDSELRKQLSEAGRINESDYHNLVKLRSLCSMCEHRSFSPKNN